MNDYEMTILAADRRRQLLGEAERHHLASRDRRSEAHHGHSPLRRSLEAALASLQRRTPASRPR